MGLKDKVVLWWQNLKTGHAIIIAAILVATALIISAIGSDSMWFALTGISTLILATLAIWGEEIRYRIAGPKLSLRLLDPQGTLTFGSDKNRTPGWYYILKVSNERKSVPAKNVRVNLTKILKPGEDGTFVEQVLSGPLQLTWRFPRNRSQYATVGPDESCTFARLIRGWSFELSTYVIPNNFVGFLNAGERMRIEVIAGAENAESNALCLEISWDGNWSEEPEQMQNYLVVREVNLKGGC